MIKIPVDYPVYDADGNRVFHLIKEDGKTKKVYERYIKFYALVTEAEYELVEAFFACTKYNWWRIIDQQLVRFHTSKNNKCIATSAKLNGGNGQLEKFIGRKLVRSFV